MPVFNFDHKIDGLTEKAAQARLAAEGYNEIPSAIRRGLWQILWSVLREPMFLLLIAAAVIYVILGELSDTWVLLAFVAVVIGITFYQEHKTERALEALKNMSSPRALVIRDGQTKRIAGREVVRDDLILLNEGDRVPADAVLLSVHGLGVDESLLTGESIAVDKKVARAEVGSKRDTLVFSGTVIVRGRGAAKVVCTGPQTEIGKIGQSVREIKPEKTPLQRETRRIVKFFTIWGGFLFVVVLLAYWLIRGDFWDGLVSGVALSMSVIPEEFPVILTVFLALGAWRIARQKVLTRRPEAVEALGAVDVLAVDKTGTLTQNHMSVSEMYADGTTLTLKEQTGPLSTNFLELAKYAWLASAPERYDPLEKAIQKLADRYLEKVNNWYRDWVMVREYSLSAKMLAVSQVWESRRDHQYLIASKGAPETIADLCHLTKSARQRIEAVTRTAANRGLKILGVAHAIVKGKRLPAHQHEFDFTFLGLLAFMDPIRPEVPAAIAECRRAGIRVLMITGDYPGTAQNIALQVGLGQTATVLTGSETEKLSTAELQRRLRDTDIIARVVPAQKLRIVQALKSAGHLVCMTGDGVNDAPALKEAQLGIAMGLRGTDVARETASLVLLDDNFASIVQAVRNGRRIFDNIKKAMAYVLAVHVPIAGLALLPALWGWPLILLPVHIAFLELIIDPACSVVFEAERAEHRVMNQPPRDRRRPIFDRRTVLRSLVQGMSVLVLSLLTFRLATMMGLESGSVRALTFAALVLMNLVLILTNRSRTSNFIQTLLTPNKFWWWVCGGAIVALVLVIYLPGLQALFHFASLRLVDWLIALAMALFSLLWFELWGTEAWRRFRRRSAA